MLQAGQHLGSYVVVGHLADGGTSEVYLVHRGEQRFALKILKESLAHLSALQARLMNEAVTLAELQLPGVVRVEGNGDFQGRPFLVMEYLPSSLAQRLARPLPASEAVPLIRDVAQVLAALHARGLVHRDVKPHNILLTEQGEPRLIDFSHAKLPADDEAAIPHSTETGAFLGTREYAAPEQLLNAKSVDSKADVYALGVVLFEALCGRRPFADVADAERVQRRLLRRAPRASSVVAGIPPALDSLVARMIERSPRKRPTAAEVATQLSTLPRQAITRPRWRIAAAAAPLLLGLSCPPQTRDLSDFEQVLDEQSIDNAESLLHEAALEVALPQGAAEQAQKRADLLREQGQLAPAIALYAEARQRFQALNLLKQQADSTNRLADLSLHQGQAALARELYEEAQSVREIRAARGEAQGGREFYFAPYRFGLLHLEQGEWDKARKKLRDAREAALTIGPLWLARTEERLASLPGEPDAPALAQAALQHAEVALRKQPSSRRARLVYLRAQLRLGLLNQDRPLQQTALDGLRRVWDEDRRQGLWAHELAELLMEVIRRDPRRAELSIQAEQVLDQMQRRSQWQGDIHVQHWRAELGALAAAQDGVLGR